MLHQDVFLNLVDKDFVIKSLNQDVITLKKVNVFKIVLYAHGIQFRTVKINQVVLVVQDTMKINATKVWIFVNQFIFAQTQMNKNAKIKLNKSALMLKNIAITLKAQKKYAHIIKDIAKTYPLMIAKAIQIFVFFQK